MQIEFNPYFLKVAEDPGTLKIDQRNLVLAFLPYLGAPLTGKYVSRDAHKLVAGALDKLKDMIGPWELVWGPGVFQVVSLAVPANTMFVAEHQKTGELFVSIAGTNPFSAYAWLVEDFKVSQTRSWDYGTAPNGAAISRGTMKGLRALQGMVPPPDVPGGNLTLEGFLEDYVAKAEKPVKITVSGHSLGGALSATLALWLLDTEQLDPTRAQLSVYAYAGPTPGNSQFAEYIDKRFGNSLRRIFNPLDVVPHAWDVADLAEIKALYTPEIRRDKLWDKAVDFAIAATNGIHYRQIGDPRKLPGTVRKELVRWWAPALLNQAAQVIYQHTIAYFELLGLPYPEQPAALGRRLAGESGNFVREATKHAGAGFLLSRTLAVGSRLFAEVYSRLPLLPSPIPDSRPRRTPRGSKR